MKKCIFIFTLLFTMSFVTSGQTRSADVADPTKFEPINVQHKITDCRGTSVLKCGRDVMMALDLVGFGGEDNFTEREETFNYRSGVSVYLFSMLGTKPSFTDEWRTRVAFTKTRTGFRFVQAGTQYRCMVNGKRGQWSSTPCGPSDQGSSMNFDFSRKTEQSEVASLDDFRFIAVTGRGAATLAEPCRGTLEQCGLKLLNALYKSDAFDHARQKKNEVFELRERGGTTGIFLATAFGYEDDSVMGERIRIEFRRVGQAWEADSGSRQFLCARGEGAGRWTNELCP